MSDFAVELEVLKDELLKGNLSEWEESFIESLDEQVTAGRILSGKQREKLHEIYERHV